MTISIELSTESIESAIRQLQEVQEHITWGAGDTVDTLARDGAIRAKAAYGSFEDVHVNSYLQEETKAVIQTTGDANIIAEFGAGYATYEDHPYAAKAPVPIEVASYSEMNDGMFYWSDYANPGEGYWFFGGREYQRVEPRLGLLMARDYIRATASERARELIKL